MGTFFRLTEVLGTPSLIWLAKSAQQGEATTAVAAVGEEWEGRRGRYLEDCEEVERGKDDGENVGAGRVQQTFDEGEEKSLWGDSLGLVGFGAHA